MRSALLIFVAVFLMAACSTASVSACPSNVPVSSSLVFYCFGNIFDFGHDLQGHPANPLPLGGSITLESVSFIRLFGPYLEWDLNFSFTQPAKGTTELDFSIFKAPCNCQNGVTWVGLGMNLSPFGKIIHNPVTESGSDFLISEMATNLSGRQSTLILNPSLGNVWGTGPGEGSGYGAPLHPEVRVTTIATDYAGDLTGFNEGFAVPEPQSPTWVLGWLLGIYALRLRTTTGRVPFYKQL